MTDERANEIAYTKRICEFCVCCETDEDCMKCDRVKPISSHELHEYHDAVMAALRAQRNSGWISIKDRLPEDKGRYLVFLHEWSNGKFLPKYDDLEIRIMRFTNNGWSFPVCVDKRCEADTNRAISHWMPLPEPPKEVQP